LATARACPAQKKLKFFCFFLSTKRRFCLAVYIVSFSIQRQAREQTMTIWFDVDDLIAFFRSNKRPTGIQRLSFETYRAIWRQAGASGKVRFCRRGEGAQRRFRSIDFPAFEAHILAASTLVYAAAPAPAPREFSRLGRAARRYLRPQVWMPLGVIVHSCKQILRALRDLAGAGLASLRRDAARARRAESRPAELDGEDVVFHPGDWFVHLGAHWDDPYDAKFLAGLRAGGIGFALMVYDLIPEFFPEWCAAGLVTDFTAWLRRDVPQADVIFTISRCAAADITRFMARIGKIVAAPVMVPVGSGKPADDTGDVPPRERPYVLMVGTVEPRKNLDAMLRVWRRLLRTMPEGAVPDLVVAGKVGWCSGDVMQQLYSIRDQAGKIHFVDCPTDAELAGLYRHCLFGVFPSFYEGWGLPVTEALSFGKTVAASSASSIPEAGGEFCVYFDPDDINDAYGVIRGLIENPARIAALEARIAAGFRPPGWEDTAAAVLARLGCGMPAGNGRPLAAASGSAVR
jgi:glycosyltransferase involved in cell wall biosynthesis